MVDNIGLATIESWLVLKACQPMAGSTKIIIFGRDLVVNGFKPATMQKGLNSSQQLKKQ
jgi:hypothetical protein